MVVNSMEITFLTEASEEKQLFKESHPKNVSKLFYNLTLYIKYKYLAFQFPSRQLLLGTNKRCQIR